MQGALSAGFEYPSQKFFAITYSQVSYRPEKSKKKKKKTGQEIYSLSELAPGMLYTMFTVSVCSAV